MGGAFVPNEEGLAMIMSLGFTRDQAVKALKSTVSAELENLIALWLFEILL